MAGNLVEFSDANFQKDVLESPVPVLVDFWAPWCGPCRMLTPTVEELAGEYAGRLVVGKLNIDESMEVPANYGVSSIPRLILFRGGQVVETIVGLSPKKQIKQALDQALA